MRGEGLKRDWGEQRKKEDEHGDGRRQLRGLQADIMDITD